MEDHQVPAVLWTEGLEQHEGRPAQLEIEREEPNEISVHTFVDGRGSLVSFVLDRESALKLLAKLAEVLVLR